MNMNAMLIRTTVLLAVAAVVGFSAASRAPAAHALAATPTHLAPAPAITAVPIVELPTISVRPSAADMIAAREEVEQTGGGALIDASTDDYYDTLTPNLPSLRMDMPYYSFGKALRRGVKE